MADAVGGGDENASDQGGVPALLDALAETVGEQPETVLADAGYSNERDLADLETRGIVCVLGPGGEGGQAPRPGEVSRDESPEKLEAGGPCGVAERWLSEAPNGWIKHVLGFRLQPAASRFFVNLTVSIIPLPAEVAR